MGVVKEGCHYFDMGRPTMTFEDVKKVFFKYDGSLFAMAREEKEAYEGYKRLNISEEMAEEWRQELFFDLWEQLKESGASELFHRMYNLSENKHSRENLLILKEALYKVNYTNPKVNACICEAILGRKDLSERSGMIFWAYDLGEFEMTKELLQFSRGLATVETSDKSVKSRLDRIMKKSYLISSQINDSTFPA